MSGSRTARTTSVLRTTKREKRGNSVTQELAAEESFHSYESAIGGVPAELRCGAVRTDGSHAYDSGSQ